MKKAITLILALTLALSLVTACSGSPEAEPSTSQAVTETPAVTENPGFEEMNLVISTSLNSNDTLGVVFTSMMDRITEATDDAVTFTVHWSSTLANADEELYLLENSAIDFCQLQHMAYGDVLPLFHIPQSYVGTPEESREYFYNVLFNNEETAAIEAAAFDKYNAKMLALGYTGSQGYYATFDWNSLADLKGKKMGCVDPTVPTYLGLNPVICPPPDAYESLSRSVIDGATFGFDGYIDMRFYEVAPYWAFDGSVSWGSPYLVRQDLWNSFSPELQQIFTDAAAYASDISIEMVTEAEAEGIKVIEDAGGKAFYLPEADQQLVMEANVIASVNKGLERAEAQGLTDEMITVMKYAVDLQGYEWQW